ELLGGADQTLGEEEDHAHEEPTQDEYPEIGIVGGEDALEPVDAEGAHYRAHERSAAAHRDPDDHLDRGQHADPSRRDDADLPYVERAGDAGQTRGDREHEQLEGGG